MITQAGRGRNVGDNGWPIAYCIVYIVVISGCSIFYSPSRPHLPTLDSSQQPLPKKTTLEQASSEGESTCLQSIHNNPSSHFPLLRPTCRGYLPGTLRQSIRVVEIRSSCIRGPSAGIARVSGNIARIKEIIRFRRSTLQASR
jgi:hypothetical protein